ncbi:MAG TPA: alpha/beta hydrolase [Chloroflexota bacterium]|nr:alpha/beta hydrolase [Chloroflexota bacterium]
MTGMPRVLRMLILFVPALVASWSPANAQPAHPIGQDYRVPGVSAKDGSPLMLYAYEKHGLGIDPNELAAGGRIVLVLHGATTSGRVNYDVQVPGVPLERSFSLMDQLSARGYDVWTLDYQNYGRSDHHDCGLCVTTEAAARDVEAVAEFILGLRKAERLHLIGWSLGAQTGGLFAQRHPDRVNRLVLYAPLLDLQGPPPPTDEFRTNNEAALTGFFHPTARVPEAVQAYLQAALEVDAQSPNGVLVDWRTDPMKIDPHQLAMPTLVIYGADDDRTPLSGSNVYPFFRDLAASDKKLVVVPNAGHGLFMEQERARWYREVVSHLEQSS